MKTVIFHSMRNDDFSTLSKRILETSENFDTTDLGMDVFIAKLQEADDVMDGSYLKDRAFAVTAELAECKAKSLKLYAALRFYAHAFLVSEDEKQVEAATKISRTITVYGRNIRNANFPSLIRRVGNFISEMETTPEKAEAIALLKAEPWLAQLKVVYTKIGELDQQRAQEGMAKGSVKSEEGRAAIRKAIEDLFKYVEVMQMVSDKPAYDELASLYNEHVERSNTSVKIRTGLHEEDNKTAVQPEPQEVELEVIVPETEISSV